MHTIKKLSFTGAHYSDKKFGKIHGNVIIDSRKLHAKINTTLPDGEKATGYIIAPDKEKPYRAISGYILGDQGNGYDVAVDLNHFNDKGVIHLLPMNLERNSGKRTTAVITDVTNYQINEQGKISR